jgi:hypothetical protein
MGFYNLSLKSPLGGTKTQQVIKNAYRQSA